MQQQKYKNKLVWYTTIQMKYLQVLVKLISKIREYNHTISQFSILGIEKSKNLEELKRWGEGRQGNRVN